MANPLRSDTSRRLKILHLTPEQLLGFLCLDGRRITISGLPTDAKIVGVSDHQRFDHDQISLKIESAEFAEGKSGHPIPELVLNWREDLS